MKEISNFKRNKKKTIFEVEMNNDLLHDYVDDDYIDLEEAKKILKENIRNIYELNHDL